MVQAVLFDWDGTLADTAEATFRCYVRMFAELGIEFDRGTYARTYSPNWHHTFRLLELPSELWSKADERWLAHFAEERVEMFEGVAELLAGLRRRGLALGIVTSGGRERVSRELERHGLTLHISARVFGCDVVEKKPHPEALMLCLEKLGVAASEAVYVGDSPEDVLMAKAAGVIAIGIRGGYPNHEALIAAGPDEVLESLSELPGVLEKLSRGLPRAAEGAE